MKGMLSLEDYVAALISYGYSKQDIAVTSIDPTFTTKVKDWMTHFNFQIEDIGQPALVIVADSLGVWAKNGWGGMYLPEYHVITFPDNPGLGYALGHELTHAYQPSSELFGMKPPKGLQDPDPEVRRKANQGWLDHPLEVQANMIGLIAESKGDIEKGLELYDIFYKGYMETNLD